MFFASMRNTRLQLVNFKVQPANCTSNEMVNADIFGVDHLKAGTVDLLHVLAGFLVSEQTLVAFFTAEIKCF
jgi:hypothetical protein